MYTVQKVEVLFARLRYATSPRVSYRRDKIGDDYQEKLLNLTIVIRGDWL